VGADALAPEHLVSLVEQNDADIGPEAFSVKHNQPQILNCLDYASRMTNSVPFTPSKGTNAG
jgi:hypothetical protein